MNIDPTPRRLFQLFSFLLLATVAVLGTLACSEGNPVAPVGTILAVTANPSQIGINGTSEITIVGRRADGNPLASGTEIRLSTDLGSIPGIVSTDSSGTARAILQADGRTGAALVTAIAGVDTMAEVTVQVGDSDTSQPSLLVTVTPSTIKVEETATVTVIARRADGSLFGAGETVILTTSLGSLRPERPTTDSSGVAKSTLTAGVLAGEATITAIVGSSPPETATLQIQDTVANVDLSVSSPSVALGSSVTLTAVVTNADQLPLGNIPVSFSAGAGSFQGGSVSLTNNNGIATAVLTVTNADASLGQVIEVEATARGVSSRKPDEEPLTVTVVSGGSE